MKDLKNQAVNARYHKAKSRLPAEVCGLRMINGTVYEQPFRVTIHFVYRVE